MNLRPSPLPKFDKMPMRAAALAFDLFVLYISQPIYPIITSLVKIREKKVTASLIVMYNYSQWICHCYPTIIPSLVKIREKEGDCKSNNNV